MLTVTDSALEKLSTALDQVESKSEKACFRIIPGEGGKLALSLDETSSADKEFEHDGTTVLVLSDDVAKRCEGRTLDADQTGNLVLT